MALLAFGRERVPGAGGASCAVGWPRPPPGLVAQPAGDAPGPVLQKTRPLSSAAFTEWGSLTWVHTRRFFLSR